MAFITPRRVDPGFARTSVSYRFWFLSETLRIFTPSALSTNGAIIYPRDAEIRRKVIAETKVELADLFLQSPVDPVNCYRTIMVQDADGVGDALVSGRIVITDRVASFTGATAHVYLEDVSRADGESVVVVETVIENVNHDGPADKIVRRVGGAHSDAILFELFPSPGTVIDPHGHYTVRVWIDSDSDGREGPGDLYSDESYCVLTHGAGSDVTVMLNRF
jgi:hypothetical protein